MTTRSNNKPSVPRYTPLHELKRYGYRRAFPARWLWGVGAASACLSVLVPWAGPASTVVDVLATIHLGLLGFGLTVFGFTILGGKDDFFEPVMKSLGKEGLNALRDLVFALFSPVLVHGLALVLCVMRKSDPMFEPIAMKYAWRFVYGYVALWSAGESYESMRQLFRLAITRLVWRYKEISGNGKSDGGHEGGSGI